METILQILGYLLIVILSIWVLGGLLGLIGLAIEYFKEIK